MQFIDNSDQISQDDKRARRQDKDQRAVLLRHQGQAEQLAGAQQLTHGTQQRKRPRETDTDTYTVESGCAFNAGK